MDEQFFKDKLTDKDPLKSKKWTMTLIGLACALGTYISGLVVSVQNPLIAPHVVSLCTMFMTFLGSLVGAYTIGQSFVDWRTQGNVSTLAQSMVSNSNTTSTQNINEKKTVDITIRDGDVQSRAKEEDYQLHIDGEVDDDTE